MKSKVIMGIMLTLLVISMLTLAFNIQQVEASATIYIRADGSIEPSTANITSLDNITYTFIDNNYDSIVVERDNIVVDGAGYILQGDGRIRGIDVSGRNNVTIKNVEIKTFHHGIYLSYSSNISVSGNNMINNGHGISFLHFSDYNTINRNNISNNTDRGVWLRGSSGNTIFASDITNNKYGFFLKNSSNSYVYHNNLINNMYQVYDYSWDFPSFPASINTWDDGYPFGGNYWSDYVEKYPDAQELDGSGIWDTPYVIDADNRDRYPLMNPILPTPEFSIMASPNLLNIQHGNSDTSAIKITSISGFNQPVQLTVSGAPSGVTTTLNPEQVTPPPDGSATSTLTVSVTTTATPGSYTLTVTGTSDMIDRSIDITLEITALPPPPEWTFATITDLHIGRGWDDYGAEGYNDYYWNGTAHDGNEGGFNCLTDRLVSVVDWLNENYDEENIKFLAVLGDITDTAELSEYFGAKKILDNLEIPYIPVIGNHDVWSETKKLEAVAQGDLYFERVFGKEFFEQQFEKLGVTWWDKQDHTQSPFLQNYAFSYGGINFIGLDYARRDVKYAALWAEDFNETKTWLSDTMANRPEKTVIVFSHYPYFITGGVSTKITIDLGRAADKYNREVLTFGGHIHFCDNRNFWFDNTVLGKYTVRVIVTKGMMGGIVRGEHETGKDFLRIMNVKSPNEIDYSRIVTLETADIPDGPAPQTKIIDPPWWFPCRWTKDWKKIWAELLSPGELRVYDSQGRVAGLVDGEVKNEIPNSLYFDESVAVLTANDSYRYEVIGTEEGSYTLQVMSITELETITFSAINITTSTKATHKYTINWDALSQGEEGVTVQIDSDGDGTFEKTITSDSELTQNEFTLQVSSAEAFPWWILGVVAVVMVGVGATLAFWKRRKTKMTTT